MGASAKSGAEYSISYSWRDQFFGSNTTDAGVYKVPPYGLVSGDLGHTLDVDWGGLDVSLWGQISSIPLTTVGTTMRALAVLYRQVFGASHALSG